MLLSGLLLRTLLLRQLLLPALTLLRSAPARAAGINHQPGAGHHPRPGRPNSVLPVVVTWPEL